MGLLLTMERWNRIICLLLHLQLVTYIVAAPAYDYTCPSTKPAATEAQESGVLPFKDSLGGSVSLTAPLRFPFFGKGQRYVWINIEGLISFHEKFDFRGLPKEMPVKDRLLVAPMWANFDGSIPSGKTADYTNKKNMVCYLRCFAVDATKASAECQKLISQVETDIKEMKGLVFKPTWVLLVTWSKMVPHPSSVWYDKIGLSDDESSTFQGVIASDGGYSYSIFNYVDMNWNERRKFPFSAGISTGSNATAGSVNYRIPIQNTEEAKQYSTKNVKGKFVNRLDKSGSGTPTTSSEKECVEYLSKLGKLPNEPAALKTKLTDQATLSSCPCSIGQARVDARFSLVKELGKWTEALPDTDKKDMDCFQFQYPYAIATEVTGSKMNIGRLCCFRKSSGSLFTAQESSGYLIFYADNTANAWMDTGRQETARYKDTCCTKANMCDQFYKLHTVAGSTNAQCDKYVPYKTAAVYGDPHFLTFDAWSYTFNGYGEFSLMQQGTTDVWIQGRAGKTIGLVSGMTATGWQAFAIKEKGKHRVQVQMKDDFSGLQMFVSKVPDDDVTKVQQFGDNEDITGWYTKAAVGDAWTNTGKPGIRITKLGDILLQSEAVLVTLTNSKVQVMVLFKSALKRLDAVISVSPDAKDKTSGLLGNNNGNKDDDAKKADGTTAAPKATEQDILNFGNEWVATEDKSWFMYPTKKSWKNYNPYSKNFIPTYYADLDSTARGTAETNCGSATDKDCIYDEVVTGDKDFAKRSLEIRKTVSAPSANNIGGAFGAQHFVTFDGVAYSTSDTYEYQLVQSEPASGAKFYLQGRAVQVAAPNKYSVWKAFAMTDDQSNRILFELNAAGALKIFKSKAVFAVATGQAMAGNEEITVTTTEQTITYDTSKTIKIKKESASNIDTYTVVFSASGFKVQVIFNKALTVKGLNALVTPPTSAKGTTAASSVKGMLGNFNGDPSDDLMSSAATPVAVPFTDDGDFNTKFALTWKLDKLTTKTLSDRASMFIYGTAAPTTFDDYNKASGVGSFLKGLQGTLAADTLTAAVKTCTGLSRQCIFDKLVTDNDDYAKYTKDLASKLASATKAAAVYGDPHFLTFDLWMYTFNGLGEYTIISTAEVSGVSFMMQGRTSVFPKPSKADYFATQWSAFAFKDSSSPRIQVSLVDPNDATKGLKVWQSLKTNAEFNLDTGSKDITAEVTGTVTSKEYQYSATKKLYIYIKTESNKAIGTASGLSNVEVTFQESGFRVVVWYKKSGPAGLACIVYAPSAFYKKDGSLMKGLLGNYNGKKEDDVKDDALKDVTYDKAGTATTITPASTEKEIFKFPETKWKTKETSTNAFEKSLFIYPKINNKATTWKDYNERAPYLPTDNTKVKAASTYTTAKTNCKDNEPCIYDYVVTGNKDYADFTLALFKLSSQFAVMPPTIQAVKADGTAITVVETKLGDTVSFDVKATPSTGDTIDSISLLNKADLESLGATFTKKSDTQYTFSWKIDLLSDKYKNQKLSFVAKGKNGLSSQNLLLPIKICDCKNAMKACDYDHPLEGTAGGKTSFRIYACKCEDGKGYTGDNCATNIDGCVAHTCKEANCVDIFPGTTTTTSQDLYTCTNCKDTTYFKKTTEKTCQDIDECTGTSPKCATSSCAGCKSCFNTYGGFECICKTGYKPNEKKDGCEEINECKNADIHKCQQICKEKTGGGFTCSCNPGFTLASDGKSCVADGATAQLCPSTMCQTPNSYCRKGATGSAECACFNGYEKKGTRCEDINECNPTSGSKPCSQTCNNKAPGYSCDCNPGFKLGVDKSSCIPCDVGTWGKNCQSKCNCAGAFTICDPASGCKCAKGFKGNSCNEDIDECATADKCGSKAAGNKCFNTPGSFTCTCASGWTKTKTAEGEFCQPPKQEGSTFQKIMLGVIGGGVGLAVLGGIIAAIVIASKSSAAKAAGAAGAMPMGTYPPYSPQGYPEYPPNYPPQQQNYPQRGNPQNFYRTNERPSSGYPRQPSRQPPAFQGSYYY